MISPRWCRRATRTSGPASRRSSNPIKRGAHPVVRPPRGESPPDPRRTLKLPAHWSFPPAWLVVLPMAAAIVGGWGSRPLPGRELGRETFLGLGDLADPRSRSAADTAIAEEDVDPDGTGWRTTGGHLALRAVALGSTRAGASREESARFLLDSARKAAPLEPASRIARADLAANDRAGGSPLAALGLSRDTVAQVCCLGRSPVRGRRRRRWRLIARRWTLP